MILWRKTFISVALRVNYDEAGKVMFGREIGEKKLKKKSIILVFEMDVLNSKKASSYDQELHKFVETFWCAF